MHFVNSLPFPLNPEITTSGRPQRLQADFAERTLAPLGSGKLFLQLG